MSRRTDPPDDAVAPSGGLLMRVANRRFWVGAALFVASYQLFWIYWPHQSRHSLRFLWALLEHWGPS